MRVPQINSPSVSRTYMEGFTIHGLSKVFVGKLWEKIYWGLVLAAVIGFLSYKVHGFHQLYQNKEFRTEIRMIDVLNRSLPEVKICTFGRDFCYKSNIAHLDGGDQYLVSPCQKTVNFRFFDHL